MDKLGLVTTLQVVEYRSIIEIGQVDHVIALFKFGRIEQKDRFFSRKNVEYVSLAFTTHLVKNAAFKTFTKLAIYFCIVNI